MKRGHPEVTKRAGAVVRSLDEEARSFDVTASTEALDSHREVVRQDWRLDRFKANPVVFFGHESWDLPIGKASDVRVEDGELRARVTLLSAAANPKAEQVFQSMREGALTGVSVGFRPGKRTVEKVGGRECVVLSDNELLEISIVGVPANPEARAKDGRDSGVIPGDAMKNIVTKALGLSTDASDEAASAALETAITEILGATGAKSLAAVPAAVEKIKLELAGHAEKAARLAALEAEQAKREAAEKAIRLTATIDEAVKAGKITPAKRGEIETKAAKFGQEWLDELVASLPVQGGTLEDAAKTGAKTDSVVIDAEIEAALAKAGLTKEDYLAAQRAGV